MADDRPAHAQGLDLLRNRVGPSGHAQRPTDMEIGALWGGEIGVAWDARRGPQRWYGGIEDAYWELDRLSRMASRSLLDRICFDKEILALQPDLHWVRAGYEYDKETALAHAILDRGDAARSCLARVLECERYWALGDDLIAALSGLRSVAVIGSGPLPLTAIGIARQLGVGVTCIERDREALELGREVIDLCEYAPAIQSIQADILDIESLETFDAILGTAVLGVDARNGRHQDKAVLISSIFERVKPGVCDLSRCPRVGMPALSQGQRALDGRLQGGPHRPRRHLRP